jgi:hypothetical protein
MLTKHVSLNLFCTCEREFDPAFPFPLERVLPGGVLPVPRFIWSPRSKTETPATRWQPARVW